MRKLLATLRENTRVNLERAQAQMRLQLEQGKVTPITMEWVLEAQAEAEAMLWVDRRLASFSEDLVRNDLLQKALQSQARDAGSPRSLPEYYEGEFFRRLA